MARIWCCVLIFLLLSPPATNAWLTEAVCAVVGGVATVALAPIVLPAVGFTSAGIAAGSLAATAMSTAWSTGVGVGLVAAAQSAGAVGAVGLVGTVAGGAVGAGVGHVIANARSKKECGCENDCNCE
ncbi:unnamed protein product [Lymnaea stagnalis]|uniref:Uncharacterized protein n=1 Tax=Lymnaea stagnalis TaxID=6523 RepID=A0AAV2HLJ9_LYMST